MGVSIGAVERLETRTPGRKLYSIGRTADMMGFLESRGMRVEDKIGVYPTEYGHPFYSVQNVTWAGNLFSSVARHADLGGIVSIGASEPKWAVALYSGERLTDKPQINMDLWYSFHRPQARTILNHGMLVIPGMTDETTDSPSGEDRLHKTAVLCFNVPGEHVIRNPFAISALGVDHTIGGLGAEINAEMRALLIKEANQDYAPSFLEMNRACSLLEAEGHGLLAWLPPSMINLGRTFEVNRQNGLNEKFEVIPDPSEEYDSW